MYVLFCISISHIKFKSHYPHLQISMMYFELRGILCIRYSVLSRMKILPAKISSGVGFPPVDDAAVVADSSELTFSSRKPLHYFRCVAFFF